MLTFEQHTHIGTNNINPRGGDNSPLAFLEETNIYNHLNNVWEYFANLMQFVGLLIQKIKYIMFLADHSNFMIREVATQRTTTEKWIAYEVEGSLILRGRGTPDRIEGSELQDTETPT